MLRTAIWFAYFWISLIFLTPSMLHARHLERSGRCDELHSLVNKKVSRWMGAMLWLAGVTVSVSGHENIPDTPCVFVSNHQGNFDIPLLLRHLDSPHGVVAKAELHRLPFIRVWMRYLGCVFIDRHNPRQSVTALNEAAQSVQNGRSMIVFPEGTRSRSDSVGEFKSGGFKVAFKAGAPIVPVCIDGSFKVMEANKMLIKPARVNIRILPKIETSGLSKDELHGICEQVRELIIDCKPAAKELHAIHGV